ncbi:MAG: translocase FtsK protein [Microgenomates group bacterium GW2011_GWC1_41_20]|nr:MAG: translocase FtsK protein [Candidatus Woesebacteria bacterium GW2011_GWF1_40_24]KKR91025.1 MAG: translocase FtsK protein [Candidatus Woesebacteria bacterium GW2011_GWD1_41_12]KKS00753.1 MAG: translocase FtsK protein [Microgenomates group bacterium GW2011_GWC1_41_20]KKS05808.1 MAG: translocase FtsK protein [Candidatus Woesebacteria bacterium GW2011_GWE1_41_24]KKS18733.1 MAG: translocase FtsK protein [Candidatus Woesebacteria bacterium GW2011_GWA1_41_7]
MFSISQIIFVIFAGLILVSFSRQGMIFIKFNDFLLKYFSWSSIFLPFIFLSFALLLSKVKFILGQPNVVVGGLLFFISVMALGRAGEAGQIVWGSIAELIMGVGAGIVFTGVGMIGLIILFNTSIDQVYKVFQEFIRQAGVYIHGDKTQIKVGGMVMPKGQMKVSGGNFSSPGNAKSTVGAPAAPKEPLEQKLVSNIPGEETVWRYPTIDLLGEVDGGHAERGDIKGNAATIEKTLESFGITANVVEVNLGPAVTQYAIEVALGTKLSKITSLERDLALALSAPTGTIRIEAPIPGRNLVGIELPNRSAEFVPLRKIMESQEMQGAKSKLQVALGLDVSGKPIVADIGKMPHVLIAGQTGSGKSVCINAFLISLLFRAAPTEVKLILVDPKRVELTRYGGLPHLLSPVIVEPDKVLSALRWIMAEMDRRYKLFAQAGARNIESYNEMSGFQALPYIVLFIDELADIMLFSPVEVEDSITRIAQMSRATGIHMVLATQRPSVDVITGLIKANVPSRIAFAVASQVDSRVILDTQGAEKLLGKGDMLYLPPEQAKPLRIQGAFIGDKEVAALTAFLKNQGVNPQYTDEVTTMAKAGTVSVPGIDGAVDDLFKDAVRVVCQYDRASASLLQRRLSIGYARAARIVDQLEAAGVIAASEGGSKPREVLVQNADEFLASFGNPQTE